MPESSSGEIEPDTGKVCVHFIYADNYHSPGLSARWDEDLLGLVLSR